MKGLVAIIMLIGAILACATPLADSAPMYVCPTDIPPPTPLPMWPPTWPPAPTPWGTPYVPILPTWAPPPPTPYIIMPPQDFYVGDVVLVGDAGAAYRVRFRLQNVRSLPAAPMGLLGRNMHLWELEVRNLGSEPYTLTPTLVMTLTAVHLPDGTRSDGLWIATTHAARAAGIPVNEDVFTLLTGETRVFHFAAYTLLPASTPARWTLELDISGESGNRITWTNQFNPYCSGDVAD